MEVASILGDRNNTFLPLASDSLSLANRFTDDKKACLSNLNEEKAKSEVKQRP